MSYSQIAVACEGQTEQQFIDQILNPYLQQRCPTGKFVYLQPIIVHTGKVASGKIAKGGGDWSKWRSFLSKLLGESHWSAVTMMLDFYGRPSQMPDYDAKDPHEVEESLANDINDPRFVPFVMKYEFETLIWAALPHLSNNLGWDAYKEEAEKILNDFEPEEINCGKETAPSKRLIKVGERVGKPYSKVSHSDQILKQVGDFSVVVHSCPRFEAWVDTLIARA